LPACEVVYASFENSLSAIPFGVFVDHAEEAVVLSIRGTLSLEDCLTDALFVADSLAEAGEKWGFDGSRGRAHRGMLRLAEGIRQQLHDTRLLQLLLGVAEAGALRTPSMDDGYSSAADFAAIGAVRPRVAQRVRGYSLLVCGHSLGAGVAALLSLMLRPRFRALRAGSLRCIAYSCPSIVHPVAFAREAFAGLVTTVIVGKDVVPRTSPRSMFKLRAQLFEVLLRSKANKNAVWRASWASLAGDLDGAPLDEEEEGEGAAGGAQQRWGLSRLFHAPGAAPESAFAEQVAEFKRLSEEQREHVFQRAADADAALAGSSSGGGGLSRQQMAQLQFSVPGRILHLERLDEVDYAACDPCCWFGTVRFYEPRWRTAEHFEEILVSPSMGLEHFPDRVHRALVTTAGRHRAPDGQQPRSSQPLSIAVVVDGQETGI